MYIDTPLLAKYLYERRRGFRGSNSPLEPKKCIKNSPMELSYTISPSKFLKERSYEWPFIKFKVVFIQTNAQNASKIRHLFTNHFLLYRIQMARIDFSNLSEIWYSQVKQSVDIPTFLSNKSKKIIFIDTFFLSLSLSTSNIMYS